jgi:hypothetical protein
LTAPVDTPDRHEPDTPRSPADAAGMFRRLASSLDDREAILRAREKSVADRSSLIAERARELAHFEALVVAREEVVRQREARIDSASDRLRADAAALELHFGKFAEARDALQRASSLDEFDLDLVARELAVELRESAWWTQVTGKEITMPDDEADTARRSV